MDLPIPDLCLVVLVGASGSGKTTFAGRHFRPTEVVSSDACRALLADDENDQSVTPDAFAVLHDIAARRLARGRLTVVDATNVKPAARAALHALARKRDVPRVALVFDLPEDVLVARHAARGDRAFGVDVVRAQRAELRHAMRAIAREGFERVHVFTDPHAVDAATIVRTPAATNRRSEHGPFDIVGDVHGCIDELLELCGILGYDVGRVDDAWSVGHPEGRKLVFVGDLVDRGPDTPGVVRLVRAVVAAGAGYCVAGNHDVKLARALRGGAVQVAHGLERSLAQLADADPAERAAIATFLEGLAPHHVFDDGRLVVAHAGLAERLHGRSSARARAFALYGMTSGATDEHGLPVRLDWARDYRGRATVVHGHTPVVAAEWFNDTICIDTGCVFGGALTALRYPERELVSVRAHRTYEEPPGPLAAPRAARSSAEATGP